MSLLPDLARIVLVLLALLGALFMPWWVPVLCMLVLSLRYEAWEVPLIGLWMDLLWLPGGHLGIPYFTLFGLFVAWAATPIRRQLLL